MGYEYGDAQNTAVRVLLNQVSKNFKYFDSYYCQKTLEYFDYKCPYTGEAISLNNCEKDHIVPMNKKSCGLHVYGNILLVTRKANSRKSSLSLEKFLENEPERLEKIKKFISESGYNEIHKKYNEQLKYSCEKLYKEVGILLQNNCDEIAKTCNLKIDTKPIQKGKISKRSQSQTSLSKEEIVSLCRKNGINIGPVHNKAAKNNQNKFWVNPSINNLSRDWWLSLDDCESKILYCFNIPAYSISENQVVVRSDKKYLIDLQIYNEYNFVDARSGLSFAKWLVKTIRY